MKLNLSERQRQTVTAALTIDAAFVIVCAEGVILWLLGAFVEFDKGAGGLTPFLIGASHHASLVLWEPGGLASPGMESMAEWGETLLLEAEVGAAIQSGSAGDLIVGASGGRGVLLVRNKQAGWSPPSFYNMGAASLGLERFARQAEQ